MLRKPEWVTCYEYTNRLAALHANLVSRWSGARSGDGYLADRHWAYSRYQWYFLKPAKTQACRGMASALHSRVGHLTDILSIDNAIT